MVVIGDAVASFFELALNFSALSYPSHADGVVGSARISVLCAFMFDGPRRPPCSTTGRGSGEIKRVWLGKSQLDMVSSLQMLGLGLDRSGMCATGVVMFDVKNGVGNYRG